MHLNRQHRKFVHRLLTGATAKDAYLHAFPDATPANARSSGPRLAKNPKIQAELTTLREKAESVPDTDFLTYIEIRKFHARIVRACAVLLPDDSDLWNVRKTAKGDIHLRFPDKLRTLAQDAKLAGFYEPQNRPGHNEVDELADLLERIRDGETVSSTPSEIPPPSTLPTAFTEPQPPETSYFPPAPPVPETLPAPTEPDPTPNPPKNVRPTLSPREWVRLYGNPYKRSYGSSFFALLAFFFLALSTFARASEPLTRRPTSTSAAVHDRRTLPESASFASPPRHFHGEPRTMISRRTFLSTSAVALASTAALTSPLLLADSPAPRPLRKKAVNLGMAGGVKGSLEDKFKAIKDAGFDGVELNLPDDHWDPDIIQKAKQASGLEIAGSICTTHWAAPLSDPKPEVREQTVRALQLALKQSGEVGAASVLLVPGKVTREVSYEECWRRSIEGLRRCLETAEASRCPIAIENVWNLFITNPAEAVRYVDELNSPWACWHFDIGNAVTYGWPEQWIRSLGPRLRNLHIKEYSRAKRDQSGPSAGFNVELGEPFLTNPEKDDGVNWAAVVKALDEVGYAGWAILEVGGGDAARLKFLAERTTKLLPTS